MNSPVTLGLSAAVLLAAILGAWESGRRFLSEYWLAHPTVQNVERATRLSPDNGYGWYRLGHLTVEQGGSRGKAIECFETAVSRQPYYPAAWIALALQIELAGDVSRAEEYLLRAASMDTGYEPRWTLANFYLRQAHASQFWRWIQETCRIRPRGVHAAMELCWRAFESDPKTILDQGVPDEPDVNRRYFEFLVETGRAEAAFGVWRRIIRDAGHLDQSRALTWVTQLRQEGMIEEAVAAWNDLCRLGYVPFSPLSLESGQVLTNGGLQVRPTVGPFDWQLEPAGGIRTRVVVGEERPGQIAVSLSGAQAESVVLVVQDFPVRPREAYVLGFRYRTEDLPEQSGVGWRVRAGRTQHVLRPLEVLPASQEWTPASIRFCTEPDAELARLELAYRRVPGTTRERGTFRIGELTLRHDLHGEEVCRKGAGRQ